MLIITKKIGNVWEHNVSIDSKGYARGDTSTGGFVFHSPNGQAVIPPFNVSVISLVDETTSTTYPTFATVAALMAQLRAIGYVGFEAGGATIESLNDINNVSIVSPSAGQSLLRNAANTGWENGTPLSLATSQLIGGVVATQSNQASANYIAQYAVMTLGFSPLGQSKNSWLCNATTDQRIVIRFGRTVSIQKIVILNYFSNTSGSITVVSGTGNAGINNCVIRAITGDESLVTTTHDANLSELTTIYTGVIPQVTDSQDVFLPSITATSGDGIVIDGDDNHGSPSNMGVRQILIYGI